MWQSSGRKAEGTIAEEAFPLSSSPPAASASSAASEPLSLAGSEKKHAILSGTGTGPHRSALKSGDLTPAPTTATLVAAVTAGCLLAASRAGNPAVAEARSIGLGCGKGLEEGDAGNACLTGDDGALICTINLSSSGGLA